MSIANTHPAPFDVARDVSLNVTLGRDGQSGFQPLRWLRTRLFRKPVRHLSGEHAQAADAPTTLAGFASAGFPPPIRRGHALRRAHLALQRLLGGQEGLRQVLPHLSLLEQTLARKGSKALQRLPASVMQHALEQLEDLLSIENNADLAVLRTRLVEALALRSVMNPSDSAPGAPQSIFGLEVQETSHSAFDRAMHRFAAARQLNSRH